MCAVAFLSEHLDMKLPLKKKETTASNKYFFSYIVDTLESPRQNLGWCHESDWVP